METVNLLLAIVGIAALIAVSTLCVYLITVLVRIRSILEIVEHDIKEISARAIPVLENLEAITDKVKLITETISEQVESVKYSIGSLREVAESIVAFERRVQERIEEPVMDTIDTFASIFKGIQSLIERLPFVSRLRAQ
jgi:uncharacterized protein YoxC